jgi:selenocysteine lyase/cysteine desulfurase
MEMMYVGLSLFRCTRSCPGVLLAKKRIFKNVTPSCVGGGVVEHVSRDGAIWIEVSSCSESGCTRLILKVRTGRISKRGKRRERPISLELFGVVLSLRWYVQGRSMLSPQTYRRIASKPRKKSLPMAGSALCERRQTAKHLSKVWARWSAMPNIVLLGAPPEKAHRVPIVSFQIKGLHMTFVNTLMNDLLGIQASLLFSYHDQADGYAC